MLRSLARVVIRRLYVGPAPALSPRWFVGRTADPDVHANDSGSNPSLFAVESEETRKIYEPKYDDEESLSGHESGGDVPKRGRGDPLVLPRPPFSSSPKIESVGVAPPMEPVVQQKRRETSSSLSRPVAIEASCADLDDGSPWPPQEKDREETTAVEDDSDMEYYRQHKASPLSHVKFVDTRKPITRATSGTADSGNYGGVPDIVGWRPEQLDTAEEALQRAARIWKESAMTGDPDSPQSRVLTAVRRDTDVILTRA